jgi:hypothetical protein
LRGAACHNRLSFGVQPSDDWKIVCGHGFVQRNIYMGVMRSMHGFAARLTFRKQYLIEGGLIIR